MQDFVHLHVHTQYSILDGQANIKKLVDKAIGDGMRGMAITDHGNMFGIKEFFNEVEKVNKERKEEGLEPFKPIFGCEMYCARRSRLLMEKNNKMDQSGWHLILLAKNKTGYHNLIKLVSHAWVDGFYYRPRTDHEELEKYHEGLIVSSACLAGEIPWYIRKGMTKEAEESIEWFKSIFGDDFYLELMRHEVKNPNVRANRETFPLQQQVNNVLMELARKHDVKLICTNDSHFVDEENAEAHDRLICLSTGKDLDDPTRMLYSKQEWFKTRAEMSEVFSDVPEALSNTIEILDKVEFYSINHAPIMPYFPIPEEFGTEEEYRKRLTEKDLYDEFTQDENGNVVMSEEEGEKKIARLGGYDALYRIKFEADYLAHLAYEGAKRCYGDPAPEDVMQQVKFELHIMKTMGFPGYFLIVQDYINAARKQLGVWVGPGRGSAAGSVVAYCLDITRVDPIKYDLLFERFLNPDRISLPDIDVDFDDDGRGKVLQYVTEKYGAEKVAHIITYGTMATKLAIKDVARVQKVPLSVSDELCKAIPDKLPSGNKMNLKNAINEIDKLREAVTSTDPLIRDTMSYAQMLENNVRNTGVHACGTIICRDDITDWVPVSTADDKESGGKVRCTQYDGHVIEETGLIKMDFLGLKNLSIMKETVANIKDSLGIDVDVDSLDINDPATYRLYSEGRTVGTFQFESAGMQKYLRELQPSTFEDLIAMNALYRPGPMDYIPRFIDRKLGREPITYDIPCMEKYLKDTYGITVYQEQVMLLSRQLAGFTRGESDTLRKAMGKKQKDKLEMLQPKFIEGGMKNGHDPVVLEKIWNDWRKFASYAFNKSHATCYSWVAYQTAYLKAHYPAQYMAASMSRSLSDISTVRKLMDECKSMGISTLGPDVNESHLKFAVNKKGDIRFGLGAVKGVGTSAAMAIINERVANGPFTDIFNFVERVSLSSCNRKGLECLALAGALDSIAGFPRETFFCDNGREQFLDVLIRYGNHYQIDKLNASNNLFGGMMAIETVHPQIPQNVETWSDLERLNKERDLVGIYLSAHPLDEYAIILKNVCNTTVTELGDLEALSQKTEITFGGIVNAVFSGLTKKGTPYGKITIEDYNGSFQLALFGQNWADFRNSFFEGVSIFVRAQIVPDRWRPDKKDLRINSVELLADVKKTIIKSITLTIDINQLTEEMVEDIREIAQENPGDTEMKFNVFLDERTRASLTSKNVKISVTNAITDIVEKYSEAIQMSIN
ncbi:MAG: DNA polymerase III subunit alpha [Bacteroidaceae bacterium]|nr:DNA polymerase III subunit alpha [Bacteroidaceae bacterium]